MTKILCEIYKSSKVDELYLYVRQSDGLKRVPPELLERFGRPTRVLPLMIGPESRLAQADATRVLAALDQNGYYLQLPEPAEDYMSDINRHNSKLGQRL